MNDEHPIYKNTLANLMIPFLPVVISLILMPFIIGKIGEAAFGFWVLSFSIVGYAGLLDMGLSQTVIKKVSELIAIHDLESLKSTCSQIFSLYCILGILVVLIFFLIGKFTLTSWFQIPPDLYDEARLAFYVIGINAGFSFLSKFWEGIVVGIQNFVFRTKIMYLGTFLQFVLILILLSYGFGLMALVSINLVIEIVKCLAYYNHVRHNLTYLKVSFSLHKFHEIIPLLSLSIQFFILQACFLIIWQTDRIVIGVFLPIAYLTLYEVALRINETIRSIVTSLQGIAFPLASELYSLGQKESMQKIVLIGTKYVFILFFLLAIPAVILSKEFITIWMGADYLYAAPILLILLIGQVLNAFNFITVQVFQAMGKLKVLIITRVLSALMNLILSVILIEKFGLIGVALATTIQFGITELPLLSYLLKNLDISIKDYFRGSILSISFYAAISGSFLYICVNGLQKINVNPVLILIAGGILYLVVYLSLIFVFNFKVEERNAILKFILPSKYSSDN